MRRFVPRRLLPVLLLVWLAPVRASVACDLPALVREAIAGGDFARAERIAKAAALRDPDEAEALLGLAKVYMEWAAAEGRRERKHVWLDPEHARQAVLVLEKVVARWPERAHAWVCLLETRQLSGDEAAFVDTLERAERALPAPNAELMGAVARRVRVGFERGQLALLRETCDLVETRNDVTVPARSNCGLVALRNGRTPLARARFERAFADDPSDALVAQNLGTVQIRHGDIEAALGSFEALTRLRPDSIDAALLLAIVRAATRPRDCAAAFEAVARATDPSGLRFHRDDLATFVQQTLEAIRARGGLSDGSLVAMARSLMEGQPVLSAALLHGVAGRRPDDPTPRFLLAQAYEGMGAHSDAFEHIMAARARTGNEALLEIVEHEISYEAGRLAYRTARYADAARLLEHSRKGAPDRPNLEYLLGNAYLSLRALGAAKREYTLCLERETNAEYQSWCRKNLREASAPPAAPAPAPDFAATLRVARSRTDDDYERRTVEPLIEPFRRAMHACVPLATREQLEPRTLLIQVSSDGEVAGVLQDRHDHEPACFAHRLRGVSLPPPPEADWWLVYEVEFRPTGPGPVER